MSNTSINYETAAKGKRIWAKAELATAQALSMSRKNAGKSDVPTTTTRENCEHIGSYFFTTDQLSKFSFGSNGFFTTDADVSVFDQMNIEKDIDLVLSDLVNFQSESGKKIAKMDGLGATISVKSMSKAITTGNISLELKTFNDKNPSISRKGWVFTSKADYYALSIGSKVLLIAKAKLLQVMEDGNWRVSEKLTPFAKSFNEGRTYNDASNMLIPVEDLIEHCHVLDLPEWYVKSWKRAGSTSEQVLAGEERFWQRMLEKKGS